MDLRLDLPVEALHCLSRDSLAEGIDARVREAGLPTGAIVDVTGEPAGLDRWRLGIAITVDGESMGRRELIVDEPECETVVDTLAVVVVLALRGSATPEESPRPGAPARPVELSRPAASTAPSDRSRPPKSVSPRSPMALRLRADAGALLGHGDSAAVVGGFGVEIRLADGVAIGALAIGRFPSAVRVSGGELVLSSIAARVYVCGRIANLGTGRADVCGALDVGVLRSAGRQFDVWNGTSSDPFALIGPGLRYRMPVAGPRFVQAELMLGVPLVRPVLRIENESGARVDDYRSPILTLTGTAGVGIAFR